MTKKYIVYYEIEEAFGESYIVNSYVDVQYKFAHSVVNDRVKNCVATCNTMGEALKLVERLSK